MSQTITLRLHELGPEFIRDLKQRYRSAEVQVIVNERTSDHFMDETTFWDLIALFDWEKTGDDQAVIEPAVHSLSEMPEEAIKDFADILSEKLWLLDTEAHARPFTSKHPKGRLSVDDFLYVRCCVVANGQSAFEEMRKHPEKMPDMTFSALLHLPALAYERKTGTTFSHLTAYNYETYSNENGWM
jgi:hypothetical protein